jgi:AcrR family transcriptional regulator
MARPPDPEARQRLLAAARIEFVSNGLDGAKVEHIAKRAGLSKGAFYLHYESKTEAFEELVGTVISQLHELMSCSLGHFTPKSQADADRALDHWFTADYALFKFLLDHRDVVRLIMEGGGSGKTQHLIEQFALQTEQQTATYLRNGIAAGLYRADLHVETAAAFIAGGYDRAARRILCSAEPLNLADIVNAWQQQVVMGVGTEAMARAAQDYKPFRGHPNHTSESEIQ